MRASMLVFAFAAIIYPALAFIYPEAVPLHRRQAPGTPEYDCHADCGAVIVDGRTQGYCNSTNFTTSLNDCLDCALQFNIWQYYGNSVAQAAQGCGLDATPVPANATSAANGTSSSTTTASATDSASPSETAQGTAASSSAGSGATAGSSTAASGSSGSATAASSGAAASATSGNAGSRAVLTGGLAMIPLAAAIADFV
ncbi:uncharacterized protein PV06_09631 [Exophiala oligosperma]|uniref:Extracellular membrane protein CFEM domain-containing protein n=1 Tax=Exophiala oligosperma TaxID=215243 RepID=A0A0D2D8A5_9EURO|nr:uncharacterized protein PV06_09631 [Exophiala oligosperma]KIW38680.1 hypothetical protein PV06_09631 [Exophiala oligosperma]